MELLKVAKKLIVKQQNQARLQNESQQESSLLEQNREMVAARYLTGEGIEIGALYNPLKVPASAKVKYVDRLSVEDLRKQYQELNAVELVEVDIIDNGELLETIPDKSQDFVIANHFIEHCQDPIRAIANILRVLKNGGILYLAVPDKRYSFDRDRPVTTIDHLLRDYQEGPALSKKQHFEEWVRLVNKVEDENQAQWQINELLKIDYSIHYHVWTQAEFLEFILFVREKITREFEVEMCLKNDTEFITILRKH